MGGNRTTTIHIWYNTLMGTNWFDPFNEQALRDAVAVTRSIAGTCRALGLADRGGNYKTIKNHIARLDIDTSHHTGLAWNRENYSMLSDGLSIQTIKKGLIRENGNRCWECGLSEWLGSDMPLEIDHIDGVNSNNDISNLRLLCPNCHALTDTWRGRNIGRAGVVDLGIHTNLKNSGPEVVRRVRVPSPARNCIDCGITVSNRAKRCMPCDTLVRKGRATGREKINWPSDEDLANMVTNSNYSAVGRALGVSDNAVRKRLAKRGDSTC